MSAELLHQLTILRDRVAELETQLAESQKAESALRQSKAELEMAVEEYTSQLQQSRDRLQQEICDRQFAEEKLKKQEHQIKSLLNNIPHIAWLKDPESIYIAVNEPFAKACGLTPEDIVGKTDFDLWPSELATKYRQDDFQIIASGQQKVIEESIIDALGNTFWVETIKTPIYSEGKIIGTTGFGQDITVRKQAEIALEKNEIKYRSLVDTSQDMIWSVDLEGCYTFVNPAVRKIYGYEPEEMIGRQFTNFLPPQQIQKDFEAFTRVLGGEALLQYESVQLAKDGRPINLIFNAIALRGETGNIIGATGLASDISLRKLAEAALAESEAKFRRLVENANDLIYEHSIDSIFTYLSPKIFDLIGYEISELLGKSFVPLIHPEDLPAVIAFLNCIIETGEKLAGLEFRTKHKDSSWHWITCNISPVKDADGNIISFMGIARDIRDRKLVEETLRQSESQLRQQALDLELALRQLQRTQSQLIQSEKMSSLGQLVAGVAHEINNPVNFIYGNLTYANDYTQNLLKLLQLYQKHYPEPVTEIQEEIEASDIEFFLEDLPKILSSMKLGSERIQQIVTSLRSFSRMDEAEMKEVNIHEGIDSTLMILQHRIKAKSDRPAIHIIKEYGKLPLVECSAGQLNQVFMNILSNALDALDERDAQRSTNEIEQMPSSISIHTAISSTNYVEIRITDNGPGIPKSILERLFDPFFTTKAVGKGTGMGLSISYQIITERHGGTLECISVPGEGAEFKVMIPLKPSS
ncbi:PAS domain S-box protein [Kamptonema sp. UHCC 0994]|uniref:PAS domain-containing sensor histidine kinase n=1 Tax=Kamptonema sp. UHCC 0994 TaxID=3031329 RepID=UPI0023B89333|nr:PAS domain S-box protein [Kamptonema sp. UHCC 0994]MDF0554973.1 PAS domain S-box protein [Kamptonema sp. UHCC 0994]